MIPPKRNIFPTLFSFPDFQGAFWGLMIGLVVGAIRMGLDFGYGSPGCGEEDNRPLIISKVHFLHFTIILFFVSLISTIVISLATGPIDDKHVSMTLRELPIECKYLIIELQQYIYLITGL